jgi:peptidoglycan-associated lipoprotein
MSERTSLVWATLAVLGILGALGCRTTSTDFAASPEQPVEKAKALPVETEPETPPRVVRLEKIYFDLDRWELDAKARDALSSHAKQIQARGMSGVVKIEGHCDARGSDEYNIALGQRRAAVVKRYLVDLGVPEERVRAVSYGESRPAVRGGDEEAWRLNRRAELRLGLQQASR